MFLRRSEEERRCRSFPFAFEETNDSQFLLKVVMGPDLDLNKDEVEMVVLKRLWLQGGGVLFLASLHLLYEFGGAPHTDDHDVAGRVGYKVEGDKKCYMC